jgi:hypothetical protein
LWNQVGRAIVDVVHRHDRRGGLRALDLLGRELFGRELLKGRYQRRMARSDRRCESDRTHLLAVDARGAGFAQHRIKVQLEVLGIVGKGVAQVGQVHEALL